VAFGRTLRRIAKQMAAHDTKESAQHIPQQTHGKIFEYRCKFHPGICQYQAGHSGYYCKLPVEVSPCISRQKLRHA